MAHLQAKGLIRRRKKVSRDQMWIAKCWRSLLQQRIYWEPCYRSAPSLSRMLMAPLWILPINRKFIDNIWEVLKLFGTRGFLMIIKTPLPISLTVDPSFQVRFPECDTLWVAVSSPIHRNVSLAEGIYCSPSSRTRCKLGQKYQYDENSWCFFLASLYSVWFLWMCKLQK